MAMSSRSDPDDGALDPSFAYHLVRDELAVRRETGHDVADCERRLAELGPDDEKELFALYDRLLEVEPDPAWPYVEPSDLEAILGELPRVETSPGSAAADLEERIHGGWLGRIAGCNLGKPVEERSWTSARLKEYLEGADAYPLLDYIPALDPMPEGFRFRECWTETTRGRIHGSARDDDIDYSILALHLLEEHGEALRPRHVAEAWVALLPYHQVFTAERATYRNLVAGVPLAEAARFQNPYREWIGAQIRGDVFGWVHPGGPRAAAVLAYQDASLSHTGNGIYGEMWVAALGAAAFGASSLRQAVIESLDHVPPRSRLAEAIRDVLDVYDSGASWDDTLAHIQHRYGHYFIVHTINNAAVVVAGLLWGDHDYARTVGLTVQGAWDTDSNGATAGGVAGIFLGAQALPERFVTPLDDRVRSAVLGFDGCRISDLAQRTTRLVSPRNGTGFL
jgi:ADP-ribosylglycohydrolase